MLSSLIILVVSTALSIHASTLDTRGTGIPLSLYTDEECVSPSTSAPNITLELNVCAVTTGMESFVLLPTPCISGNVEVWGFVDNMCENLGTSYWSNSKKNCYASSSNGAIAAIMLTCDANTDETEPSSPTSTTTISVGPVANTYPTSTTTPSSSSGTGSTPNSNPSPWDNLKIGVRIGIIFVGVAAGISVMYLLVRGIRNPPPPQERRFQWQDIQVTQNMRVLREV
ncbi:hypothetical protein V8E51_012038 [Hyaloscypha variabilis]|jgi:hypothetical protein|uniref:Mid2 domain-containing protein n=1 Tax=Hyaloscypha variabilis (strain UAMH 11265 / GT02V1 / F) TaxID=1149755 RepID=A0A2J6RWB8_HYAVF|nr:hypothetical protein L207DRAFT_511004 [Hyaloscypha variabilis F]